MLRGHARQRIESLDAGESRDPADPKVDLERQAEVSLEVRHVLDLMARLPERQRVVAQLYYLGDQPQAAVAEFLGISVSAVNNRLREARTLLRREGVQIMTASMHTPDFAEIVGTVIRANGLTIDTSFDPAFRPALLTAVEVGERERATAAFVSQYLDDDTARLVTVAGNTAAPAVIHGAPVRSGGQVTDARLSEAAIGHLVEANRAGQTAAPIQTGIKAIDLLAPLVQRGVVALVGAMNVGKLVLVEELVMRLSRVGEQATLLVFLKSPDELGIVHQLDYRVDGGVGVVVVPVGDASPEALASALDRVDTVIAMSLDLGRARMYPAIDPVMSRAFTAEMAPIVGRATALLREGGNNARACLLRAYLTQPFFVAEPHTGRPGVSVDRDVALADVGRILDGDVSGLDADSLLMGGSLAAIDAGSGQ